MKLGRNFYKMHQNIHIDVKNLIKSGNYESIVLNLMNASTTVFPGRYIHLSDQAHGECDFKEVITGEKFDAKIPITQKQGKTIGSRNGDVTFLVTELYREAAEFGKCFEGDSPKRTDELELYRIMENLIKDTEKDENVIFFIPYPIVFDFEGFPLIGAVDILKGIYQELSRSINFLQKHIYAIYIAYDKKIVVRNLGTDCREYLSYPEMSHYVKYDISTIE